MIICLLLICIGRLSAAAPANDLPPARDITLPSPVPSGSPVEDTIWIRFYPAAAPFPRPTPAVILLHPLGVERPAMMDEFARYLAARGIAGAVMTLPYHMRRLPKHEYPLGHYTSGDIEKVVQAFRQAIADVRAVTDWLEKLPDADPSRIGVIGVSLGAIIAHSAMGEDSRLSAGVTILGGADFPYLYRHSVLYRILHFWTRRPLTGEERAKLRTVDPLTYAGRNRPRRVLMIQAARDLIIPPADATELWNALGRPPIRWLDTNHYGPVLSTGDLHRISAAYLRQVWGESGPGPLPSIYAFTIKVGAVWGPGAGPQPALTWQALSLAEWPNHTSMLHLDLGWGGGGFFAGLATTLNEFMDLGIGRRFGGGGYRPYVSLHLVF